MLQCQWPYLTSVALLDCPWPFQRRISKKELFDFQPKQNTPHHCNQLATLAGLAVIIHALTFIYTCLALRLFHQHTYLQEGVACTHTY